jgi:hypothetical protein
MKHFELLLVNRVMHIKFFADYIVDNKLVNTLLTWNYLQNSDTRDGAKVMHPI